MFDINYCVLLISMFLYVCRFAMSKKLELIESTYLLYETMARI